MKIAKDGFVLFKQLIAGKASREVYFLFAIVEVGSFLAGLLIGAKFL
jgi:hypothetical protein